MMYKMQVALADESSTLNVRNAPSQMGERIDRLNHGTIVTVQAEAGDWKFVTYEYGSGYVSNDFLIPYEEPDIVRNNDTDIVRNNTDINSNDTAANSNDMKITIIDSVGNHFEPIGDWRVLIGSVD